MYYLFCINDESYNLFYNNSSYLYYILKVLLHIKKEDFIYGYNLYKSICIPFKTDVLKSYFKYLDIKPSRIIINNKNLFRLFNIYNKKIFVVDFKNKKYFWIKDILLNR